MSFSKSKENRIEKHHMSEAVERAVQVVKALTAITAQKERLEDEKEEARCAVLDASNAVYVLKKAARKVAAAVKDLRNGEWTTGAMDKAIEEAESLHAAKERVLEKKRKEYVVSCTDFIAQEQLLTIVSAEADMTPEQSYASYLKQLGDTAEEVATAIEMEDSEARSVKRARA